MPSKSKKQARFMAAAAHNPKFAKKAGIKQSVAKEFNQADAGTGILKKAYGGAAYAPTRRGAFAVPAKGGLSIATQSQKRPVARTATPLPASAEVETGDRLRNLVSRARRRFAEGGKVGGPAMTALRELAKKFEEALAAGDTVVAQRLKQQMELMQPGSTKGLENQPGPAPQTLKKGGRVK